MEIINAIEALQSLAQETRLGVFRLLVKAGPEGLMAGEIAERMDVPGPTLSFHLNILAAAGLLDRRREGRALWYSVNFGQVGALLSFLMEDCCQGQAELGAQVVCGEKSACGDKDDGCCG